MTKNQLPLPPHYSSEKVSQVWKVDYQHLAEASADWAAKNQIKPAAEDRFRVCLVAVDVQNTFCIPGFGQCPNLKKLFGGTGILACQTSQTRMSDLLLHLVVKIRLKLGQHSDLSYTSGDDPGKAPTTTDDCANSSTEIWTALPRSSRRWIRIRLSKSFTVFSW
jgi:hypothetical protein